MGRTWIAWVLLEVVGNEESIEQEKKEGVYAGTSTRPLGGVRLLRLFPNLQGGARALVGVAPISLRFKQ